MIKRTQWYWTKQGQTHKTQTTKQFSTARIQLVMPIKCFRRRISLLNAGGLFALFNYSDLRADWDAIRLYEPWDFRWIPSTTIIVLSMVLTCSNNVHETRHCGLLMALMQFMFRHRLVYADSPRHKVGFVKVIALISVIASGIGREKHCWSCLPSECLCSLGIFDCLS